MVGAAKGRSQNRAFHGNEQQMGKYGGHVPYRIAILIRVCVCVYIHMYVYMGHTPHPVRFKFLRVIAAGYSGRLKRLQAGSP